MEIQATAMPPVGPYVAVDGFVADSELAGAPEMPADLLRAPLPQQEHVHDGVLLGCVVPTDPRPAPAPVGPFLRLAIAVVAIVEATVARKLPGDGAAVPAKGSGDGGGTMSFLSKQRDRIPLFRGELAVRHG